MSKSNHNTSPERHLPLTGVFCTKQASLRTIEESSQCNDHGVVLASVECVGALLGSLEALCRGEGINQEAADLTNSRYALLDHADYTGPLTYQSLARLPKPYR